jgi:hypothetical protein
MELFGRFGFLGLLKFEFLKFELQRQLLRARGQFWELVGLKGVWGALPENLQERQSR